MTYPGDSSLSDEIRERIVTTFEQALDLAAAGSRREALLGCDFVLRLDPLFEPARILHKRLSAGGEQIQVEDLRTGSMPCGAAAASDPAATVSHPPTPKPIAAASGPAVLGDIELDPDGPETASPEPTLGEDPLADTIFAETPKEPTDAAEEPPAPPAVEEVEPAEARPVVERSQTMELESILEESAGETPRPASAAPPPADSEPADRELVRTFLDTPVDGSQPTEDGLVGGLDPAADMAEPLAAPTQLDDESQRRIEELLKEGQDAFDIGEYQSAIDSWSRVFLIDIDHSEANQRIEQARRMAAEAERQIEEVFHEAISHLDAGDGEAATESLRRVLELHPGHLAAQELLDKIESGEALPEPPRVEDPGPTTPAGFDLEESHETEGRRGDLFAAPDIVPAAAELEVTPPPPPPARATQPRQTFLIFGSLVLLLVIAGGWYLMSRWESLFPNSDIAQEPPTPQRIDPIARAKKLHEQGKTAIAIAQLRRLPPGDPHYAEGQALVAQWETAETEPTLEGPSEEEMRRYDELLDRAREARALEENLLAENLLSRAAAIAPLDEGSLALQAEATEALEPLAEQIQVFRSGDWEYALPTLWRMHEDDASNSDINRLIVDSYYNLGVRDLQRGRSDLALRKFEEALGLRPEDPTLKRLQAFAATYQDRSEDLLYRIFVKYLPFR